MLPTILLLVGLSSSVGLGESSPGFVTQAIVQGGGLEAVTSYDTTDKYTGAGYALGQSVDVGTGRVFVGADYRYRNGGDWSKQTVWVRAGATHICGPHGFRAVVRTTAYATEDTRSTAAQVEYQFTAGRYVFRTTQGYLWFSQPSQHGRGYFMTALGGIRWAR